MCRNAEKMLALECRASRDSRSAADALDALRARLADLDRETERQLQLCLRRVQFAGSDLARKTLVDRLLIDHLLRRGWLSTARSLAAQVQLTDYVDVALFDLAQYVRPSKTAACLCADVVQAGDSRIGAARRGAGPVVVQCKSVKAGGTGQ